MTSIRWIACFWSCAVFSSSVLAQFYSSSYDEHKVQKMTWCTTNAEEQYKCQNFTMALERDRSLFVDDFFNLVCKQGFNSDECVQWIDRGDADVTTLDAGEVFTAGRFNSLVPLMQEAFEGGFLNYYAVAVLKKDSLPEINSLYQLRGKKACFAGVGSQAGWTIPIHTLQRHGGMDIVDCNNHVKTAIEYFGPSCAVNSLINKYNPIGDNSDKLCSLCTGKVPGGKCTSQDPYAGFEGAFRCLLEAGDVAFLKHNTIAEMAESKAFRHNTPDQFELLCKDGSRQPVAEYRQCNWGAVPSHAIVISSAKLAPERHRYERFLTRVAQLYSHKKSNMVKDEEEERGLARSQPQFGQGGNNDNNDPYGSTWNDPWGRAITSSSSSSTTSTTTARPRWASRQFDRYGNEIANEEEHVLSNTTEAGQPYEKFELFESTRYGTKANLMFQDSSRSFSLIPEENQNYAGYLGDNLKIIFGVRDCPVQAMTLCVTSDPEMEKCIKMKTALKAQLIKPEMHCYKAHSHINCMQAIRSGVADVSVFDASDVYTGGFRYDLIPFMSEVYNLGSPEYYVVAIAKDEDPDTELTYLKNKRTCHSGVNTAAGWVFPMAYLISNGWIRPYGCDSLRAAAEYFSKSCVPGALSHEYSFGIPYNNLCDLCHGASRRYCRRDASEDFYGHTGALRCLVEGGGDVAFTKHTTVSENTGGKRREWWARNRLNDDFQLLCPDGTRGMLGDYERCNLGKVKANAIMTRGGEFHNETQMSAYMNLFIYAQQFYGRKEQDAFGFSMFYSYPPYSDLIFQDATRQLVVIPEEKRAYDLYLGGTFMRARRITDCDSGAAQLVGLRAWNSILVTIGTVFVARWFNRQHV